MLHLRRNRCCVPLCDDVKLIHHRFPREQERFKIWISNIASNKFDSRTDKQIQNSYQVCQKHFEPKYILPGTKLLHRKAIPTLYLAIAEEKVIKDIPQNQSMKNGIENVLKYDISKIVSTPVDHSYSKKLFYTAKDTIAAEKDVDVKPIKHIQAKYTSNLHKSNFNQFPSPVDVVIELPCSTKDILEQEDDGHILSNETPLLTRCRVCLVENNAGIPLNHRTNFDGDIRSLWEILNKSCNVEISIGDQKPQTICIDCVERAKASYEFNITCEKSDLILQNELDNLKLSRKSNDLNEIVHVEKVCESSITINSKLRMEKNTVVSKCIKLNKKTTNKFNGIKFATILVVNSSENTKLINALTSKKEKLDIQLEANKKIKYKKKKQPVRKIVCVHCCRNFRKQIKFKMFTNVLIRKKRKICVDCGARFAHDRNFTLHQHVHQEKL